MNVNLVGGDPYGGACSIDQFFIWRPFPHSTNATGWCNLHHIGASTHPGPGLGGGSGYNLRQRGWAHDEQSPPVSPRRRGWARSGSTTSRPI
jgi:phytoene dehydrogenase-like protein